MHKLKPLRRAPAYQPRRPLPPVGPPKPTLSAAELAEDELDVLRALAADPCTWVTIEYRAAHRRLEQAGAIELRVPDAGRRVAWRPAMGAQPWRAAVTREGRRILGARAPATA